MKNVSKFKIFIVSAFLAAAGLTSASAEKVDVNISKDIEKGIVTINAVSDERDVVFLQVLPADITPEMVQNSPELGEKAAYVRNETVGESKKVTFEFPLKSGNYVMYLASSMTDEIYSESLIFANSAEYSDLIKLLKSQNKTEFVETTESNKYVLGFDIDIYSESAAERFYDEYKDELSETDYEENLKNFKKCGIIEKLNSGKIENAVDYIKEIYSDDEVWSEIMDKHITSDETEIYYTKKLMDTSKRDIKDSDDLEDSAKEALILTVVRYSDKPQEIEDLFNEYKDILGLKSVSEYSSVYRGISGKDFSDIDELIKAYKDEADGDTQSGGGGGSGSGGSSGGKNKVTPSTGISGVVSLPGVDASLSDMQIFDDIDNVSWAKDAIEALYKKGIVNGRGEGVFAPSENVLREEYVKMLVETFDLSLKNKDLPFEDVSADAWYYNYVNMAYVARAVNGISETEFGVGQNITRQDLCTMTMRMFKSCAVEIPQNTEKITFKDEEKIADYAKEAVEKLQCAGIISGNGNGEFNPTSPATRAETAKIMYGVLQIIERRAK